MYIVDPKDLRLRVANTVFISNSKCKNKSLLAKKTHDDFYFVKEGEISQYPNKFVCFKNYLNILQKVLWLTATINASFEMVEMSIANENDSNC